MGKNLSKFDVGEDVWIGLANGSLLREMQQNQAEWNTGITECLKGPCKIIQTIEKHAIISGPSGNVYRIDSNLLTKYENPEEFESGDMVEMIADEDLMGLLQIGHGEMPEGIKDTLGELVKVIEKDENGDYTIDYNGNCYTINVRCIQPKNENIVDFFRRKIKEGDKTKLITDVSEIRSLQHNHGGWNELMVMSFFQDVEIVKIMDDGDCYISVMGMEWLINCICIETVNERYKAKEGKLKKGDIVVLSEDTNLSKEILSLDGLWNPGLESFAGKRAIVQSIYSSTLVAIKIKGKTHYYNRLLLQKVDDNAHFLSDELAPGDTIKISSLEIHQEEGTEDTKLIHGARGKVKAVLPNGDLQVKIMGDLITLKKENVKKVDPEWESDSESSNSNSFTNESETLDERSEALFQAILDGDLTQTRNLTDLLGANVTRKTVTPLIVAVESGHLEIVKFLLENKAEVNAANKTGDTALIIAVKNKEYEMAKALIEGGADVNHQNLAKISSLMLAAAIGSIDILRLLLKEESIQINAGDIDNNTALYSAVESHQEDCVKILLDHGADVRAVNSIGFTSFHLAAQKGLERILEIFLKKEGSCLVDLQTSNKLAAIHLAVINNHIECLKLLIKFQADVNIRTDYLKTPLHLAIFNKHLQGAKVLVDSNADLNLKDELGNTPLHDVMRYHNNDDLSIQYDAFQDDGDRAEDIILFLVSKGARFNIKNHFGVTPIDNCMDKMLRERIINIQSGTDAYLLEDEDQIQVELEHERSEEEKIEKMRQLVKDMEDQRMCKICRDRLISVTLGCGHVSCDLCANNSIKCPFCGVSIKQKIRIYE